MTVFEGMVLATILSAKEYYEEREKGIFKISKFKKQNMDELAEAMVEVTEVLIQEVDQKKLAYISKYIIEGAAQLPLMAFCLVLQCQKTDISKEQEKVLEIYFSSTVSPYTKEEFLNPSCYNDLYKELAVLLGADNDTIGMFWQEIIKISIQDIKNVSVLNKIIILFTKIIVRFAALGNCEDSSVFEVLQEFSEAVLSRTSMLEVDENQREDETEEEMVETNEVDNSKELYVSKYEIFKNEYEYVVEFTNAIQEGLPALDIYPYFCMGVLYDIIKESTVSENEKIEMLDFVLLNCNMDFGYSGVQIVSAMEDKSEEIESKELACSIQEMVNINAANNFWMIMATLSGKCIDVGYETKLVEYCIDFLFCLEGMLLYKYPGCGLDNVSKNYVQDCLDMVSQTINAIE